MRVGGSFVDFFFLLRVLDVDAKFGVRVGVFSGVGRKIAGVVFPMGILWDGLFRKELIELLERSLNFVERLRLG